MKTTTKAKLAKEKKALLQNALQKFGENLADTNRWDLTPDKAIVRHLVNQHHWLPAEIRRLSNEDLALVLGL